MSLSFSILALVLSILRWNFVHTICRLTSHKFFPLYLLVRAYQPYLALSGITQFINNSLTFTIENFPLAPDQHRLPASATFVVCIPSGSLLTKDVTGLSKSLLREGSGCESTLGRRLPGLNDQFRSRCSHSRRLECEQRPADA